MTTQPGLFAPSVLAAKPAREAPVLVGPPLDPASATTEDLLRRLRELQEREAWNAMADAMRAVLGAWASASDPRAIALLEALPSTTLDVAVSYAACVLTEPLREHPARVAVLNDARVRIRYQYGSDALDALPELR